MYLLRSDALVGMLIQSYVSLILDALVDATQRRLLTPHQKADVLADSEALVDATRC